METEETPSVATGTGPVTTDDVSKDDDEKERDEDNEGERKVTSMVIKKGLRSFSGWSFTEDSDEFEKRVSQLER